MATMLDKLDVIDKILVNELISNARSPYIALSRKAGINIATTRKRVEHLLHEEIIRLELIPNPGKLGYHTVALIGIHVQLSKSDSVLQKLKVMSPVTYLSLTTGQYDILLWALFKSPSALANFREKYLSLIDGIEWSETMIALKSVKTPWDRLYNSPETTKGVDVLDAKIIDILQREVRIPVASLANKLQISVPTIRQRMKRLRMEGIVDFSAIVDPLRLGYQTGATIGLRVCLSKIQEIERKLANNPNVQYIYHMAGQYDILLWVQLRNTPDLNEFIRNDISPIDGIEQSETFVNLEIVKWSFQDLSPV